MLLAKKELLLHLVARVSCLLVVVALIGAPVGHVAHAKAMTLVPEQGLDDDFAPATDPCENSGDCKIVCQKGNTQLFGLWISSPQTPEPSKFHALAPCMPREKVQSLTVDATRSFVSGSQNQTAYLATCRLRL